MFFIRRIIYRSARTIFFRVRHHASELLLGAGVIGGIYIIFSVEQAYITGIVLSVISALLASVFTIMNKKLVMEDDHEKVTFYELATGFIFLTVLLPFYLDLTGGSFDIPSITDTVYLLLLSVICTTFAFTISMESLKTIKAFTMNLSVNLEPVYSIVLAMLIFHEQKFLDTGFFVGTLIIIGTVVIHSLLTMRKTRHT